MQRLAFGEALLSSNLNVAIPSFNVSNFDNDVNTVDGLFSDVTHRVRGQLQGNICRPMLKLTKKRLKRSSLLSEVTVYKSFGTLPKSGQRHTE